jgi:hypothetical protein
MKLNYEIGIQNVMFDPLHDSRIIILGDRMRECSSVRQHHPIISPNEKLGPCRSLFMGIVRKRLHSSHLGERVRAVGNRAEAKPRSLQGTPYTPRGFGSFIRNNSPRTYGVQNMR